MSTLREALEKRNETWYSLLDEHTVDETTDWDGIHSDWMAAQQENWEWDQFRNLDPYNYEQIMEEDNVWVTSVEGEPDKDGPVRETDILSRSIDPRKKFMETKAKAEAADRISK